MVPIFGLNNNKIIKLIKSKNSLSDHEAARGRIQYIQQGIRK